MSKMELGRPASGKRRLKDLLLQKDNRCCADCNAPDPKWASANIGVFICLKCCGAHRSLGTHISKVLSVTLDDWSEDEIDSMIEIGGNTSANSIYEAFLPEGVTKPGPDSSHEVRMRFIRLEEFNNFKVRMRFIARSATILQLKAKVKENRPDIIFLSETKIQLAKMCKVMVEVGFTSFEVVPAKGISGGLCLAWSQNLNVEVVASNKNFISMIIKEVVQSQNWSFTGIYAPPEKAKQQKVWDAISSSLKSWNLPSIVVGDFNNHTSRDEKIGGRMRSHFSKSPFVEFIHNNGLIDLGFIGNPFTWSDNRRNTIQIRLDRGLVNADWQALYPRATITHLARINSDHAPILVNTSNSEQRHTHPFRFERMWIRDPRSFQIVHQAWNKTVYGSFPIRFKQKVSNTSRDLKSWNKQEFGNCIDQTKELTKQIDMIQKLTPNDTNRQLELRLKIGLNEALAREDDMWKQKSRIKWRDDGDKATKFFFLSTVIRRRSNAISSLCDDQGNWFSSRKRIGEAFTNFYEGVYESSNPNSFQGLEELLQNSITDEQNEILTKLPTFNEIKQVVFAMEASKAPGPDGMPALFYQTYWSSVGRDICLLVQNFFRTGIMPLYLNRTYCTLIPKTKTPTKVEHYRPISLCNVAYKVISKTIANRLKSTLDEIISPLQTAFLPGRNISDNIVLTQELIHQIKIAKGNKRLMAIKFDMAKAYDRVEWVFVEKIMTLLGYHKDFVHLIMQCISTTSSAFLINGRPFGNIHPKRGIRQGDPLSSYLFLLCGEVLSRILTNKEKEKKLNGVQIGKGCTPISHLMFADDLICFANASRREYEEIREAIKLYGDWSGQAINENKSGVLFSKNTHEDQRRLLQGVMGMGAIDLKSLYLGQPFTVGKSKAATFNFIIERVMSRVAGWKSKVLSYAGREILIKSTLASIPAYSMMHFNLTKGVCSKINGIIRKFWWNHDQEKSHNFCPIAWDKLCKPKEQGGLGFRLMEDVNNSFLAKLAWQMIEKKTKLWVEICSQKYCRRKKFMELGEKSNSSSYMWKGILKGRDSIKVGLCWEIGNGSNTNPYTDPWVPGVIGHKPVVLNQKYNPLVSSFLTSDRKWDMNKVKDCFDSRSAIEIQKITLSSPNSADLARWNPDPKGKFSISSCYNSIIAEEKDWTDDNSLKETMKNVWKSGIHNRQRIFLWRILRGALATKDILKKFLVTINPQCVLCNTKDESALHLFADCEITRKLWFAKWGVRIEFIHMNSLAKMIDFILKGGPGIASRAGTIEVKMWGLASVEKIWKSRNEKIFNAEKKQDFKGIGEEINMLADELLHANNRNKSMSRMKLVKQKSKYELQEFLKPSLRILSTGKGSLQSSLSRKIMDTFKNSNSSKMEGMVEFIGLLKVKVVKGVNLAIRDMLSSDPYVVLTIGKQTVQTTIVKSNLNPVWNEELMLSVPQDYGPVKLQVFDHDTFSADDIMGEAEIDIQPLITSAMAFGDAGMFGNMQIGKWLKSHDNALLEDSTINIADGKVKQDMMLKLQNVESGELELEVEWMPLDQ